MKEISIIQHLVLKKAEKPCFWNISLKDIVFLVLVNAVVFLPIIWNHESEIWGASDNMSVGYPTLVLAAEHLSRGELPMWNSRVFAGRPFLADPQSHILYPFNWPILFYPSAWLYNIIRFLHYPICSLFAFMFLRELKIDRRACLFGATVFSLSGFNVSHPAHFAYMGSTAWTPAILLAAFRLRRGMCRKSFMLGAICIALQIYGGHFQFLAYTGVIVFFLVVMQKVIFSDGLKVRTQLLSTISMYGVGGLLSAAQWWPTLMVFFQTRRTSLTDSELLAGNSIESWPFMAFPWWKPPLWAVDELPKVAHYGYMGLFATALAVYAVLWGGRKALVRWAPFLAITAVGVSLSFGFPAVMIKAFTFVPPFAWFRDLSRHVFEYGIGVAVLSSLGLQMILNADRGPRIILRLGFILIFIIGVTFFFDLFCLRGDGARLYLTRLFENGWRLTSFQKHPVFLLLPLWGLTLGLLGYFLYKKMDSNLVFAAIFIVQFFEIALFIDSWTHHRMGVDRPLAIKPLLESGGLKKSLQNNDQRYLSIQSHFVYPHIGNLGMLHQVDNALGYNPLISSRFMSAMRTVNEMGVLFDPFPIRKAPQVLDMLSVRYCVLYQLEIKDYFKKMAPYWSRQAQMVFEDSDRWKLVYQSSEGQIYENRHVLPRVWTVKQVEWISKYRLPSTHEVSLTPLTPQTTAIVETPSLSPEQRSQEIFPGQADIRIVAKTNDRITYEFESFDRCFVVFSEAYDTQWKIYIDHQKRELFPTNGLLMGTIVPSGKHTIELHYQGGAFGQGVLLVLMTSIGVWLWFCRKRNLEE